MYLLLWAFCACQVSSKAVAGYLEDLKQESAQELLSLSSGSAKRANNFEDELVESFDQLSPAISGLVEA
jgi:hypothetical protein